MAVPPEILLHPELLSNEQLRLIILERYLKLPNLVEMDRSQLLDVFHHFCVPYGQRKCRDTNRGKFMNKTQQISPEPVTSESVRLSRTISLKQSFASRSDCERLKPPPDMLSGQIKRIKIEGKTTIVNNIFNINKRKGHAETIQMTEPDNSPVKKQRKPITWP